MSISARIIVSSLMAIVDFVVGWKLARNTDMLALHNFVALGLIVAIGIIIAWLAGLGNGKSVLKLLLLATGVLCCFQLQANWDASTYWFGICVGSVILTLFFAVFGMEHVRDVSFPSRESGSTEDVLPE
jgi:hypothetical protein